MKLFIRARHWQLFIIMIGGMIGSQFLIIASSFNHIVFAASTTLFALLFFGWIFSIGTVANEILPEELKSSPKYMQASLIYAVSYLLFASMFVFKPGGTLPGYVVFMHLAAMAGIFYSMLFTAKQLAKLDTGNNVTFYQYSGPFFMLWFFPIGIWFLQPKINKLLTTKNA